MAATSKAAASHLVLTVGKEQVLIDRAISQVMAAARAADPDTARHDLKADDEDTPSALINVLSPSLFGQTCVVVLSNLDESLEQVTDILMRTVADIPDHIRLVCCHPGGVKGKKLVDTIRKAGALEAACSSLKGKDLETALLAEFRAHKRKATPDALKQLITARGENLSELMAAVSQLCNDIEADPIDEHAVREYYSGVMDVKGWQFSDPMWNAKPIEALERLRWALAQDPGSAPPLINALANGLRTLLKYASAPSGMSESDLASHVGVPAWRLKFLRAQKAKWHPDQLARAARLIALADRASKGTKYEPGLKGGASLDSDTLKQYEIEKAILGIRPPRD